jgi:predicted metallopeptidase
MKQPFIEILKIGGIMMMVLSPALAVVGLIWEQHLDYLDYLETHSASAWTAVHSTAVQPIHGIGNIADVVPRIVCHGMLFAPFVLSLGVCLHNSYLNYRAALLRQRIVQLERIWQLNIPSRRVIR